MTVMEPTYQADQDTEGRPIVHDTTVPASRHADAARLRVAGYTYGAIAERLGYAGVEGARYAVRRGMQTLGYSLRDEEREDMIELEAARYEEIIRSVYRSAVIDGDLNASKILMQAMDAKRKLIGIDAPSRTAVLTAGLDMESNTPLTNASNVLDQLMPMPATGQIGSGVIEADSTEIDEDEG